MQKERKMQIYPASKYSKLVLWLRRYLLGHYVVFGKDLKRMLPKGSVQKKVIKNKVLYGVKLSTIKSKIV